MIAAPGGIRSGRPGRDAPALTRDELKVLGPGAWGLSSESTRGHCQTSGPRPGAGQTPSSRASDVKHRDPAWAPSSAEVASELVPPRRRVKAGVACGREAATRSVGNCYSAVGIVGLARHLARISFTAAQPFTR